MGKKATFLAGTVTGGALVAILSYANARFGFSETFSEKYKKAKTALANRLSGNSKKTEEAEGED